MELVSGLLMILSPLAVGKDSVWHHEAPLFEETILMKNKHPSLSGHGFIVKEYYVQQHPERERELVDKFGNIPVEAMWFDQDLQTIEIYTNDVTGITGITGISVQTSSETCSIGICHTNPRTCTTNPRTLTLYTDEVLTEVDVRTSSSYFLALTFRTNHNRELSSDLHGSLSNVGIQHTIKTLRPPPGSRMTGLYFRLEGTIIDSIGMILRSCLPD
ncbi:hypothetical protein ACJ73_02106 [Blastomyces percursus]|uniref:Uncharacterized protein n=1 Tax=Blastomyces percursus TaxID=1658174 RepID=A0A1J9RD58_9EURO|nr:hypothetical protein ACJ73_02106 [Blastomyces percursus]